MIRMVQTSFISVSAPLQAYSYINTVSEMPDRVPMDPWHEETV